MTRISEQIEVKPAILNMALASQAEHKIHAWIEGLREFGKVEPSSIAIKPKAKEPDDNDPQKTGKGKLRGFVCEPGVVDTIVVDNINTVTTLDILFVSDGAVLTTDRDDLGPSIAIGMLGTFFAENAGRMRPATIQMYNTTGTAQSKDILKYGGELPDQLIYSHWKQAFMTLSPRLIEMLAKPKQLLRLVERGLIAREVINPGSIGAINWVELIDWLPIISREVDRKDIWMELMFGKGEHFVVDGNTKSTTVAAQELKHIARGIPKQVVSSIVNRFTN